ncbi:MAG: small nuclear ribonucleoprotein [Candidatus Bathyarchaeota archaeon B26-2]|nr:MAG: small nuclear ribonucleoprotein [Candidatus Bathyarchaeota archaeon B26-2]
MSEVAALIDKTVTVTTMNNRRYTGTLVGINPDSLSLCLSEAKDEKGNVTPKIVLSGNVVAQILAAEREFDLKGLAERLEKVFPRMVRLYEKEGFIWVMEKIKVTADGVVEGSGPMAERVQRVYNQFISKMKQA